MRRLAVAVSLLLPALAACYNDLVNVTVLPAPANLTYQVEPSGDPVTPSGILLRWDALNDANLRSYSVYSRPSSTSSFGLRGTTTSTTFHDNGYPNLDYYVTAVSLDGGESQPSNIITVDERLALARPTALTSISLDGAIHLEWTDNAYLSNPSAFSVYRVYSTGYDLDSALCGTHWALEGTTVSSTFLAANLTNGVPRCFAVSAVSIEGYESIWSPLRYDTPRPDGRNILLTALDADPTKAAFRFWLDANGNRTVNPGELAVVLNGTNTAADFQVIRNTSGIFLQPVRTGAAMQTYGTAAVDDLTAIDIAPATGYGRAAVQAVPGFGYVFQMNEGDPFYRYGALRVTAVGADYIIVDWSYQTDPGNPELVRAIR